MPSVRDNPVALCDHNRGIPFYSRSSTHTASVHISAIARCSPAAPARRRKGLAKRLVKQCEDTCKVRVCVHLKPSKGRSEFARNFLGSPAVSQHTSFQSSRRYLFRRKPPGGVQFVSPFFLAPLSVFEFSSPDKLTQKRLDPEVIRNERPQSWTMVWPCSGMGVRRDSATGGREQHAGEKTLREARIQGMEMLHALIYPHIL